jgi:hypothetical protein
MKMPEPQRFDQSHLGIPGVEAGEFLLINPTISNLMEVDSDTSPSQLLGSVFTPTPPAVPSLQDKINLTLNDINWTIKMKRDDPKEVFYLHIVFGKCMTPRQSANYSPLSISLNMDGHCR